MRRTVKIKVTGLVQGIGFRPFVAEQAEALCLDGQVKNAGGIVLIQAAGESEAVDEFVRRLKFYPPAGARVDRVVVDEIKENEAGCGFRIVKSTAHEDVYRLLPPDLPTCPRCEAELMDPKNRRYHYPFISCVSCGPRFSIMENVPYDRGTITMKKFKMCPDCAREYTGRGNVRRHAQTISCHACGPQVRLERRNSEPLVGEAALQEAIARLKAGQIGAIKDIGGFHFAFRPDVSEPARRLREFKNREQKPFAVMFPDVSSIREYCEVSETEEALLKSDARPIVLLERCVARGEEPEEGEAVSAGRLDGVGAKEFAPEVCGDSDRIGCMLPCNPLQILILKETGPLVATSGNRGGEPIITENEDIHELMKLGIPDFSLEHDRDILMPLDDSIYQVTKTASGEIVQLIRRARGLVPEPIWIEGTGDGASVHAMAEAGTRNGAVLAEGGDLKAVFALTRGNAVYMSGHFADLEEMAAFEARNRAIADFERLFDIRPTRKIGDLHPGYFSAKDADVRIQHHFAHALSVMAEFHLEGPVLGVICDGTGYGSDGTVWGGELLCCTREGFTREGGLSPVELPGGNVGSKNAFGSLCGYFSEARRRGLISDEELSGILERTGNKKNFAVYAAMTDKHINTVVSSSTGRLFDAVAALSGVCNFNSYEGQCPVELEQAARRSEGYRRFRREGDWMSSEGTPGRIMDAGTPSEMSAAASLDTVALVATLGQRLLAGTEAEETAWEFHVAFARGLVKAAVKVAQEKGLTQVVLGGGTFYNRILLELLVPALENAGLKVYCNRKVPCGDGGLALGQAYARI